MPDIPLPKAILRWQTALPIKQAIARARYKEKVETSEEAARMFARKEIHYILGIIGLMGPSIYFTGEELKAGASLIIGDLPPIQPADVLVDRQEMLTNLYLVFPKLQQGAHHISERDNSMEFLLKTPAFEIKKRFSLKDMVYQGKLEI